MRRMLTTAAIVLLAAGCATPRGYDPGASWSPLQAYIVSPERDLTFHVSRPAHVAVFEISPGEYTRLLYPTPGQGRTDGFVQGGDRVWRGGGLMRQEMAFASYGSQAARPRFVFLIASDEPLRLEAFGRGGYSIQSAMGYRSYASADPYRAMERLVDIALSPMAVDGDWATDFYVYWPQVFEGRSASRRVLVECNGYRAWVPLEFEGVAWRELCAPRQASAGPGQPGGDDGEAEDGEIVRPGRRAPIPPEGSGSRGFRPSSRQLQQPIDSRPERRPIEGGRITAGDAGSDSASAGGTERPERGRKAADDAEHPRGRDPGAVGGPTGRGAPAADAARPGRAAPAQPGSGDPGRHAEPVNRTTPALPEADARPTEPVSRPDARPASEPRPAPNARPEPRSAPDPQPGAEPRPAAQPQREAATRGDPPARVPPPTQRVESARPATRSESPPQPASTPARSTPPARPAGEGGGDGATGR